MAIQVGEFPGLNTSRPRGRMRHIQNPLDKSTVVSILPKRIEEIKHTIQPGIFIIEPGTYEEPSTLVVGPSSWWRTFTDDQPDLEIPCGSLQIADSIVKDYCNGMLGCNMDSAIPGLFFIPGQVSKLEVKTKYKQKLDEVKVKQDNWYKALVRLADSLWARSNGNPLVIADEMRLAARSLNLNEKSWLQDFHIIDKIKCIACGSLKDPAYPVCAVCKNVDTNHPLAKDLKFVS